jgi:glycosyltransferase involved in cell wall biosynthesis
MQLPVYIFDPTATDGASKVRGIGRYMEILRDYLPDDVIFVDSLDKVPKNSLFIHPFYNFLQPPQTYRRVAKKQLTVIHDLIPHKYPREFPYGFKGLLNIILNVFLLRNYSGIITDSFHSASDIHDMVKFPDKGISVAYPSISKKFKKLLKEYSKETKAQIDKPYFIYVGDATWNKNLINIAKAVKLADVHCVFIGKHFIRSKMLHSFEKKPSNPWLNELYGFYREIKDDPRFHLAGFVSDENLINYYHHAIANVLVSRDEGFGFSFLEAGVCGVPSVLADTRISHELADDGAIYADPEDPDEIAKAMKAYLDKKTRDEKIKAMKPKLTELSPEQFATSMKRIIDNHRTTV